MSSIGTPELESSETKLCRNSRGVHSEASSPAAVATVRKARRTLAASSWVPYRVANTSFGRADSLSVTCSLATYTGVGLRAGGADHRPLSLPPRGLFCA
jgi:hypothetical protein